MSVIVLFENPATSAEQLATWSFTNATAHRDINRLAFDQYGAILPDYQLDPFDPAEMGPWLYQHQVMHNAQNELLGIAGYNLVDVDWEDEDNLAVWVWNHAQEHYQASAILGLG